jgi:mRNA interferase RelE/StbE
LTVKKIAYSNQALRSLRRLPRNEVVRVREKIEQYARDPASLANNVKRLRGRAGLRLRIGDWRVIFEEEDEAISVLAVGPRGGVYD